MERHSTAFVVRRFGVVKRDSAWNGQYTFFGFALEIHMTLEICIIFHMVGGKHWVAESFAVVILAGKRRETK